MTTLAQVFAEAGHAAHPDMAVLGPVAWAELHAWADRFAAKVGDSCGCGRFAQDAARALHDVVNLKLGKKAMYPETLQEVARMYQEAAQRLLLSVAKEPWQMTLEDFAISKGARPAWVKAGYGQTARDHRRAIQTALSEGKPVPARVLADYPDLIRRYGLREAAGKVQAEQAEMAQAAPFGWPGGKKVLKHRIIALIPPHKTYVEPFAGAASVFWAKEPAEVEVLNDIDPDLMRFYRNIGQVAQCNTATVAKHWDSLKARQDELTPCEFFSAVKCSFGQGMFKKGQALDSSRCTSGQPHFHKALPEYQTRLQRTELHQGDWEPVVRQYDAPDTFFYLDPPFHGTGRYYQDGADQDQLDRLAKVLPTLKGKWLLSYDDHPEVRAAFQGGYIRKVNNHYTIAVGDNNHIAKELLIANYPLSVNAEQRLPLCTPAQQERLERCIQEVKAQGGKANPWAVCQASLECRRRLVTQSGIEPWPEGMFDDEEEEEDEGMEQAKTSPSYICLGKRVWEQLQDMVADGKPKQQILEFMWNKGAPYYGKFPDFSAHFSQSFLDTILHTAIGTGVAIGVSKVLNPPAPSIIKEEEKPKEPVPAVLSPAHVEGDQENVDLGTLLEELDAILKKPETMGIVDAETLTIVRE